LFLLNPFLFLAKTVNTEMNPIDPAVGLILAENMKKDPGLGGRWPVDITGPKAWREKGAGV
jgi:hypothetical protein